jgi:hypothetical protein
LCADDVALQPDATSDMGASISLAGPLSDVRVNAQSLLFERFSERAMAQTIKE